MRYDFSHRISLGALAWLVAGLLLSSWTSIGAETITRRVFFNDGRSLDVVDLRFEAGQAVLTIPGGNLIAFAADRILKVEKIQAEIPERDARSSGSTETPTRAAPDVSTAPPGRTEATSEAPPKRPGPAATDSSPEDIEEIIRETAQRYGLEVDLLTAVIAVESGYRVDAVSSKGAQGLMQLMPGTARELAVTDPFDPRQNIDAGARYLRRLLDANENQYWKALAAYNAGSGRVARYNGIPPYRETIRYIRRVLDLYASPRPRQMGAERSDD
jgi:soluble lytic murein transglycosylase-like protein